MKNLVKQATALALSGVMVFGSTASFANTTGSEKDLVKVEKHAPLKHQLNHVTNSMKVILGVMLEQEQKVRLEIFNAEDEIVHKNTYKDTDGFLQLFDLSELGEGEYLFRITSGNTSYIDKVTVGDKAPKEEPFEAYISEVANDRLKFSYADAKGDVTISVKDSRGETIFSESLGNGFSSSGVANVEKLNKGSYTIELSSASGYESKEVEVK